MNAVEVLQGLARDACLKFNWVRDVCIPQHACVCFVATELSGPTVARNIMMIHGENVAWK
jgi:hypothetical protein